MSGDNSSTLKSYVDSAVAGAQSVVSSITGNPADKVRSNPFHNYPFFYCTTINPLPLPLRACIQTLQALHPLNQTPTVPSRHHQSPSFHRTRRLPLCRQTRPPLRHPPRRRINRPPRPRRWLLQPNCRQRKRVHWQLGRCRGSQARRAAAERRGQGPGGARAAE